MFYDVILPLALKGGALTYSSTERLENGMRVLVPIGKKKLMSAIVLCEHKNPLSEGVNIKEILCKLDEAPIVNSQVLKLWQWISEYYMCSLGEVMKAALPSALKLESVTIVYLREDYVAPTKLHYTDATKDTIMGNNANTMVKGSTTAQRILDILSDMREHSIEELSKRLDIKSVMPQLSRLYQMGVIGMGERVERKYKERKEQIVELAEKYRDNEKLLVLVFNSLERAPKQQRLLSDFISLSENVKVKKKALIDMSEGNAAALKALVEKGILVITEQKEEREEKDIYGLNTERIKALNTYQEKAYKDIVGLWQKKRVVLLHGVTGSGKTEVYIHLIKEVIARGQQVLYLVPEIALTTQLTDRLRAVLGDLLCVYHSRISDYERADIYSKILQHDHYKVVLGVRSSIFLPFSDLGLIIVDEEHDQSYKQQDPSPRYNARNAAIVLAGIHDCEVLLGTATPAIETYYNAQIGKYGLVSLLQRHGDIEMPQLKCIDTKEHYRRKQMQMHLADPVVDRINAELNKQRQVIVLHNRRGYAPYMECKQCAYIPKCTNCDVSLTLHKRLGVLSCHYCGYTIALPEQCPACGQKTLSEIGVGTERVEDEFKLLFANARIMRMDQDTTRGKHNYEQIISDFGEHNADILIGTQMVSKGLDFPNVSTVVVLNSDNLMNQPDFRSYEYAYQLLEQVSGRAGRKGEQGQVFVQTNNIDNKLFEYVKGHDYEQFYNSQIREREQFKYPPFYRLIKLTIKCRDYRMLDVESLRLQRYLAEVFTRRVSRVLQPNVSKVQNLYIREILLKIEAGAPYTDAKRMLNEAIDKFYMSGSSNAIGITIDVDPM